MCPRPDVQRPARPLVTPSQRRVGAVQTSVALRDAVKKASELSAREVRWDSLIELRESDPLSERNVDRKPAGHAAVPSVSRHAAWSAAVAKLSRRGSPRSWAALGLVLLALVVIWAAAVFRFKTRDGTIVLEIDQPGAEVFVDGQRIRVSGVGDNKPVEIQAEPGRHKLRISKEGFTAVTNDIELPLGKTAQMAVRLVPIEVSAREMPKQSAPNARTGKGLLAEFFDGAEFKRKLKARVDANIDWLWGWERPRPGNAERQVLGPMDRVAEGASTRPLQNHCRS